MGAFIRNCKFAFYKHSFPRLSDTGLLDIDIDDIYIRIKWKSPKQEKIKFYLRKVYVNIGYYHAVVKESKHKYQFFVIEIC